MRVLRSLISRGADLRHRRELVEQAADPLHHVEIGAFAARADVVALADLPVSIHAVPRPMSPTNNSPRAANSQ